MASFNRSWSRIDRNGNSRTSFDLGRRFDDVTGSSSVGTGGTARRSLFSSERLDLILANLRARLNQYGIRDDQTPYDTHRLLPLSNTSVATTFSHMHNYRPESASYPVCNDGGIGFRVRHSSQSSSGGVSEDAGRLNCQSKSSVYSENDDVIESTLPSSESCSSSPLVTPALTGGKEKTTNVRLKKSVSFRADCDKSDDTVSESTTVTSSTPDAQVHKEQPSFGRLFRSNQSARTNSSTSVKTAAENDNRKEKLRRTSTELGKRNGVQNSSRSRSSATLETPASKAISPRSSSMNNVDRIRLESVAECCCGLHQSQVAEQRTCASGPLPVTATETTTDGVGRLYSTNSAGKGNSRSVPAAREQNSGGCVSSKFDQRRQPLTNSSSGGLNWYVDMSTVATPREQKSAAKKSTAGDCPASSVSLQHSFQRQAAAANGGSCSKVCSSITETQQHTRPHRPLRSRSFRADPSTAPVTTTTNSSHRCQVPPASGVVNETRRSMCRHNSLHDDTIGNKIPSINVTSAPVRSVCSPSCRCCSRADQSSNNSASLGRSLSMRNLVAPTSPGPKRAAAAVTGLRPILRSSSESHGIRSLNPSMKGDAINDDHNDDAVTTRTSVHFADIPRTSKITNGATADSQRSGVSLQIPGNNSSERLHHIARSDSADSKQSKNSEFDTTRPQKPDFVLYL